MVSKPIKVTQEIIDILDELGVPHVEAPRQGFLITVSPEPLPAPPMKSFIDVLQEAFGDAEERFLVSSEHGGEQPGADRAGPKPR